jgi:hypothetical protein
MAIAMGAAENGGDGVREVLRDEERFRAECEGDSDDLPETRVGQNEGVLRR